MSLPPLQRETSALNGRFSLQLTGDAAFEKSKAAAQAEFDGILATAKEMKAEERNSPGYAEREAYRKTTGKVFEIPLIAELAEKNAARNRYALTGDKQADRYNQSVFDILKHFASWREATSGNTSSKLVKLTDVTRTVVTAYYTDLTQGNAEPPMSSPRPPHSTRTTRRASTNSGKHSLHELSSQNPMFKKPC